MVKISDAEFEVMQVIWNRKNATSVEIIEDLKSFKWQFNTIRTLIKRLLIKGAIEITGRIGKKYTYSPTIDEKEYKKELTKEFIRKMYNKSIDEFVLEYAKENKLVREDLKRLINKIEKEEKK